MSYGEKIVKNDSKDSDLDNQGNGSSMYYIMGNTDEKTVGVEKGRMRSSILSMLFLSCQVISGIYHSGAHGMGL